jgi:acylphosphatase
MQARIYIFGFVQGIGFRYFVKSNARRLKLSGWVRNTDDGRVEALVQGQKETIEKLISLCKKGPFLSEVKTVDVIWEKEEESFEGFQTVH